MAALSGRPDPVETLREEAICAICLDYFADPVSIGCGHNFCRGCISRLWARGDPKGPREEEEEEEEEEELEEEEEEDEEDELDVEEQREEEEDEGGAAGEEEDDEMWEEEEEDEDEDEGGELWGDPGEEDEEEDEEEETTTAWTDSAQGGIYFPHEDFDEDVMEADVEEEEEEEEDDDEDEASPAARPPALFTCPQCRKSFVQRSFRPNLQLANMVQLIRQLHPPRPQPQRAAAPQSSAAAPGGTAELCERHREPLKLFCEVDEAAICVVCREARGHKNHSVVPLEEVVQECKSKLQKHLEPLRKQLEAVLRQKSSEEEKISLLRDEMHAELQELEADFEVLHRFLAAEQVLLLRQLQERHEALLGRQRRNVGILEERSSALRRLISEAEAAGRQDGLQLLKDIKSTFIRCENIQFQEPEMLPVDVGKKFRNCFLQDVVIRKMEKVFSKVPQANVTLDPSTAHPRLSLSLDRRSVRLSERRQDASRRSEHGDLCVLGAPGFSAGRHYWEVEVGGRRGWAVGAARESVRPPRPKAPSGGWSPPKRDVWAVGSSGKRYAALGGGEQTALAPGEQPRRFGVYLDYERGQLGFYNAESMSHIHTFHICCRDRVFPFFRILAKGTRIKICT